MEVKFISGKPALVIDNVLVAGDMHIGLEEKLGSSGIHVDELAASMGKELRSIFESSGARSIALLGDIKESIGYPTKIERDHIRSFFEELEGIDISILKGNHDAHLHEILDMLKIQSNLYKELLLEDAALLHGNAYPSEEALEKRYIIVGHGHPAYKINGNVEKVWLVAKSSKLKSEFIIAPAFNPLKTGIDISAWTSDYMQLMRNGIFDFYTASIYSLDGTPIGRVKDLIQR